VKKVFSILALILLLAVMLHISVARHYCGGELAASKISLSGGLASCGMEGTEESCPHDPPGNHLKSNCCDDVVTLYGFDNTYISGNTLVSKSFRFTYQILVLHICGAVQKPDPGTLFYSDVSPPGFLMSTDVDLSDICVFRI
jgi:hypothetical protein